MIELCVCVSHVPVVCEDGGCVGSDVGEVRSPSWLAEYSVVPVPSVSPLFSTSMWEVPVPWTGVVGYGTVCRRSEVDTAHSEQAFRHAQSCNNDE